MIRNRLGSMVAALILFGLTIVLMGPLTQKVVGLFWLRPGVTQTIGGSQTPVSFQGMILQKKALELPDVLPVYGSSEFSAVSEFHPSILFEGKPTGFAPFLVGRGGTQNLIHALNLGALGGSLKDKKIAVILSAQWFTPEGISPAYFQQNFSPLQAYRMIFNSSLSAESKNQLAKRLLEFPGAFAETPTLQALLAQKSQDSRKASLRGLLLETKGRVEMAAYEAQDALKTIDYSRLISPRSASINASVTAPPLAPWLELKDQASEQGKTMTQNNRFGILADYFSANIQPGFEENRNSAAHSGFYPSPEYEDLELLLNILQETGARPLFIIVPVNGAWYDYTGFPLGERRGYYLRAEKMIKGQGFQVANFGDHEYDTYFLQDTMHLGWKGWVSINETLDRFYHEGFQG
ncbi:D-alanyl-lipoteichoic acid biosynthesis protein DltD [Desulfosporosinus meridiei]|uniref:Protein DltD n=1 Tax=Desulfosporosinus meridiei (strain ATCC BAA-275 / DSM 13257 / KCTC 12902 / NCIMB 13706 / S10) TaxID=768704 RepID=J7J5B5_DESMD|nr:D-alanyl-lipoteichoic acid biosynthesis protein DltD [Desulfosporosinus meridiei]AFQ46136.1 D-alanyl-lipoteichoic acid biosynthesis protein DltD [Desulfosporosinus meridiei DSM 13257]